MRLSLPRFHFDDSPVEAGLALFALLCFAAWLRLNGIGWDGFAGLHPDERHLYFVTQAMFEALRDPANAGLSFTDWWLSAASPLNPHAGEKFYVYGEAPLIAGVLVGWVTGTTDWFAFMGGARTLAAVVDIGAVLAVFLGARLLAGNTAALVVAALYTVMPSALQLANFHTVDVWLSAAVAGAMVPMLALATGRSGRAGPVAMAALAGALTGLALACKITGVLLAPAGIAALVLAWRRGGLGAARALIALAAAVILALAVFRLANPFAFEGPGLFGLRPSADWIADFVELGKFTAREDFPPNWQWIAGYGVLRFLRDFVLFGAGPVATGLFGLLLWRHPRRWGAVIVPLLALGGFVVLTAMGQVSALRYATPGLGPMAVALAPAVRWLDARAIVAALAAAFWWGSGMVILHDGQHPRIAASHWLWSLPAGTHLTNETDWDESLPSIVSPGAGSPYRWPGHDGWFTFETLDMTAPDSPEKASRMAGILSQTDFLILSSDRQSAVMPRLADRFPMTTAHYAMLFSGEACFALALEIDRGYPLPGLPFDDSWAQEPWRVYDHPHVRIYRRLPCFDADHYANRLRRALMNSRSDDP
ncbi:glycosyltransferase family 39 protein [Roseovarius amoyensis]|uniref:glycosyltransferase family 39 protein n=1 Tax=Roseovarius amoyensis TaxID=2211448 RepID=UPI0013A6B16F|nr:glycosyltransferase family 39 protein [Roseovarius amoyensis]